MARHLRTQLAEENRLPTTYFIASGRAITTYREPVATASAVEEPVKLSV